MERRLRPRLPGLRSRSRDEDRGFGQSERLPGIHTQLRANDFVELLSQILAIELLRREERVRAAARVQISRVAEQFSVSGDFFSAGFTKSPLPRAPCAAGPGSAA